MQEPKETSHLIFLNLSPEHLTAIQARPPLISALQSFETALLLLAQGRYPQALTTVASAIESAGKAHLRLPPEERCELAQLNPILNGELPTEKRLPLGELRKFRETRNRLTHYGFTPRDDEESVSLFLKTALPFLDAWMEHSNGISIVDSLIWDLGPKVRVSMALNRPTSRSEISAIDSIRGVAHGILRHTRYFFLTWWEREILDNDATTLGTRPISGFDLKEGLKKKLLQDDPSTVIDCPICAGADSLVVKVDEELLDKRRVLPIAARCVECSFSLPSQAKGLLTALCQKQFTPELCTRTLKEYGVE
jgi:hypothetical protein